MHSHWIQYRIGPEQKSGRLRRSAIQEVANSSEEDTIRKAYIEIGKLYYAERGMAPEAAYVALCEKITAARTTIEENRSRIAELKAEGVGREEEPVTTDVPPEEPGSEG